MRAAGGVQEKLILYLSLLLYLLIIKGWFPRLHGILTFTGARRCSAGFHANSYALNLITAQMSDRVA